MSDDEGRVALRRIVLRVLAPFAAGYFLAFLFRSVNAVVAPDLIRDVGLSAGGLGLLTAAYFFGFAGFQLPLGLLLDRFGPRRTQAAIFLVSAAGAFLFAVAPDQLTLTLARGLIGLGFAGGLMSSFKAIVLWVPKERVPLANGCLMSVGGIGALVAATPSDLVVQWIGWRPTFALLGLATILVSSLLYSVVPERPASATPPTTSQLLVDLGRIWRDPVFWKLAPVVATTTGTHLAIQTLWAGPWLKDVVGLDRMDVGIHMMAMSVGFTVGILLSGMIADVLGRRGIGVLEVMIGGVLIFLVVQIVVILDWFPWHLPLWLIFGMPGQVGILAYPKLAEHFGVALAGRASTTMNLLCFSMAFGVQFAIGTIIDLWPPTAAGGYSPAGYRWAFAVMLAPQVLGLIWYWWPDRRPAAAQRPASPET
jgi:MFS family permease